MRWLLIIQECENPQTSSAAYRQWAGQAGRDYLWLGDSASRGLGVFSKCGLPLRALPRQAQDLKYFLPFAFDAYIILAVWTKKGSAGNPGYIGQVWQYWRIHKQNLAGKNSLLIGDFNSNAIWDKEYYPDNHSALAAELAAAGLTSLYHQRYKEAEGQETQPAYYHWRRPARPYHIDYAFCRAELAAKARLTIGKAADWLEFSDHMPLIIDIADEDNVPNG